ncbi:hypothetical protein DQD18_15180 [Salmonella enterica subsp. enterica serovar Oranienburg]|uniref:Uncharacterized protein n=1 Tax=Salmonella enterica subsp. enterica serovar Panama TaxID=29472 RepID=A0A751YZ74_SALET|nr:hypothetical protein [Salmonella enterica subsp. enterica serovar Sandiego]EAP1707833.1 hypothetical protein [Salmonella enterica]EBS4373305.1 hypothetical protein [Salmonella enterica subsp. enterica serovar Oranienburg]ECI5748659.1 hypothetical protein [Salmonella enterica subsp. enterica]ECW6488382.1 hypothetical protein [Salmonella enterica subsp. enterica serovar Rubislaw]EDQ2493192.1 hypothetical protein [Salmonella enterica subsp. enterica serovar Bonariensis]EDX8941806.1 hypothetic
MLITVELLLSDNLRRSLLTVGELDAGTLPGLEAMIGRYAGKYATIPPGMWYRRWQGRRWLTRSVPGPEFFLFLSRWREVPEVRVFLENHSRFVLASLQAIPEAFCNVWINQPEEPELAGCVKHPSSG